MDKPFHATVQPPIAIVGIGGLFPDSLDVARFWNHVLLGSDLITDVPDSHWKKSDWHDPDPKTPDRVYTTRGGYLPEVPFDSLQWGLPPNLLSSTDTSQLLALLVARATLQDCFDGELDTADKSRVSVLLGVTSGQELFGQMSARLSHPMWRAGMKAAGIDDALVEDAVKKIGEAMVPWTESTFPGLLGNVVAGRIANRLDTGGTNAVTDAACASSFAAISMGIDELVLGRADVVLTGGVDTLNDVFMHMCFSKTPALSATGECRPFDDAADGTLLGEGLGMVALRRLDDAERDGNHIYAVIRGVGTSSDGRSKSVYAPVPEGQANALRRAYAAAGYGPETVELVEAHGTGTRAGDAAELAGLKLAFGEHEGVSRPWCAVGSVKSQIGHTKAAAGSAGLLKAALALHQRALPPTIKVDKPNARAALDGSPFYVNTRARPWVRDGAHPRRASVSSFGFGGSNFHLTLEEYAGERRAPRLHTRGVELFAVSAADRATLGERLAALPEAARTSSLAQAARDAQAAFATTEEERVAFTASSVEQLERRVTDAVAMVSKGDDARVPGIHRGSGAPAGPVAFLFPGQGSQRVDMGADLALEFEEALSAFDEADDVTMGDAPLSRVIFPPPAFDDETAAAQLARLTRTEWAQPALGAASTATLRVLRALAVEPAFVAGHSFGELTALHAAGVFDLPTLQRIARARGEAMAAAADEPGAMLAVTGSRADVEAAIAGLPDVVVANHNAPEQVVLSGTTAAIDAAAARLAERDLRARRLQVATAFHSPLVAPAADALRAALADVELAAPQVPVFANTTAAPYGSGGDAARELLARQVAAPVRFVEQVEAMHDAGARVFIEVGPGKVLTGLCSRILADRPYVAVATDGADGVASFLDALAQLCAAGVATDSAALWRDRRLDAPGTEPRDENKRRLLTPLTGSNVGKPALPAPSPARAVVKEPPVSKPVSTKEPRSALPAQPVPRPTAAPTSTPAAATAAPATPTAAPVAPDAAWLSVFREGQQQAAEAHASFQRAMADAHASFLRTFEASSTQLASLLAGDERRPSAAPVPHAPAPVAVPAPVVTAPAPVLPVQAPVTTPAPVATPAPLAARAAVAPPTPAPPSAATASEPLADVLLAVTAEKTGYPVDALAADMSLEADLGIDSIKRVEILGAIKERVPGLPEVDAVQMGQLSTLGEIAAYLGGLAPVAPTPVSPSPAAAPAGDLNAAFLDVVADKTGYPADALSLDMALEADLGIDSIKRVEILGAIKERVPGLPEVDAMQLAQLVTLGEVAGALTANVTTTPAAVPVSPSPAAAPAGDLNAVFLDVVADKTGYPADALSLDMALEADLGIDSIKRVEILGAIKERVPGLPEVDAMQLAQLVTLGEVAGALTADVATTPADAPMSPSPAAAPAGDLNAVFLDVVADKTGYPADALSLDMALEADLGIDSIKRVEILGAIKERVPGLPEVDAMQLAQLVTLGEVAGALTGANGANGAASANGANGAASAEPAPAVERSRLLLTPLSGRTWPALPTGARVGLLPGDESLTARLVQELTARGYAVTIVRGNGSAPRATFDAVVELTGTRVPEDAADVPGRLRAALMSLQRYADSLRASADGRYLTVQDTCGTFGLRGELSRARALLGGLAGLPKTAAHEWPEVRSKALDVDVAGLGEELAARTIADQLVLGAIEREVCVDAAGAARTLAVRAAPLARGATPALGDRPVIVATGGARGVTRVALLELARRTRPALVLLGRTDYEAELATPLAAHKDEAALKRALFEADKARGTRSSPADIGKRAARILAAHEVAAGVEALRAAGAEVLYVPVDVRDRDALERALAAARGRFGPLSGIVHGAGVLADKRIEDKSAEDVERVIDTKVAGLLTLLDATRADPIRLIALFSSVAGRFGNAGQADYAMANEALNKLAQAEARARGDACVVKAYNWGPWDGGMVTPALREMFASRGVALLSEEDGARFFVDELCEGADDDVELVFGGALAGAGENDEALARHIDARSFAFLRDHSLSGTPVLPAVLALQFITAAARRRYPDLRVVAVRDLRVLRGVTLSGFENGGNDLSVSLREQPGDGAATTLLAEIRLDGATAPRYAATLTLAAQAAPRPTAPASPAALAPFPADRDTVYRELLFHGPHFQLIGSIEGVSDDGIVGRVSGTRAAGWTGDEWTVDPGALDAGLQLVLLYARHAQGGSFLPTQVGRFASWTDSLDDEPTRCVVHGRKDGADRVTADVFLLADDGRVLMEMRDVQAHRLLDESAFGRTEGAARAQA